MTHSLQAMIDALPDETRDQVMLEIHGSGERAADRETSRDALERLHYRTGQLMEVLEKKSVPVPVWTAFCIERAMDLAWEALEREPSEAAQEERENA